MLVWQQVLHADVQNHLLETTEQLRSLCSSTEENSGALLEVALTRQQELAQQALRRNLSIPLLIYTQSSSGWGNNILGLISTLLLAMVTKRALFVHFHPVKLENIIQDKWGVFPDLSLLATSRNMSLEKLMKNQVYSIHASEHDQIWLPFTKQMERAYLNILRFHTDSISFSNVVLQSNQFFAPLLYIRKDYNYQLCRILGNRPFYSIANKVLQFTPEIKRAALVFMQEMQFHKKLVIGMQIRLRNNAPRWKKLNSLDRLRSTVQSSDDTDNLSHIRKMTCLEIATFDSRRANRYFLNDSTQIRAAKHAFVDIFLLSQTDQMVSSWGSTFGYLAHGISGRPPFSVDLQGRCSRQLKINSKTIFLLNNRVDKYEPQSTCHPLKAYTLYVLMKFVLRYKKLYPPHLSEWCSSLGTYPNVLSKSGGHPFVSNDDYFIGDVSFPNSDTLKIRELYLRAGPRETCVFHPQNVKAAVVTCGGLAPGMNSAIAQYGFRGFLEPSLSLFPLNPDTVNDISLKGGSILGSSREVPRAEAIVDAISDNGFNQVYIIGGGPIDGTLKASQQIFEEVKRRKMKCAVAVIPKTIDNDIMRIQRSFGFETSIEAAAQALRSIHCEASCSYHAVAVIQVPGRNSGFFAVETALASRLVDACLIPEFSFKLNSFLNHIYERVKAKGFAMILVADGAGHEYVTANGKGYANFCPVLMDEIRKYFDERMAEANILFHDVSFIARTVPSNAADNLHASILGSYAAHGCFAGFSGFATSMINDMVAYIPLSELAGRTKTVPPQMWSEQITASLESSLIIVVLS
ncbi:ATP-dependent 6-phosphofructokinase 5, chloroplastic [Galdieria sulphuraria]|nr:ATP-dependent 6-phosphofructokinase 5, chloroplastic [Galdieria sulphuraria]